LIDRAIRWVIITSCDGANTYMEDLSLDDSRFIEPLTWEDSYAIALALHKIHPQVDLEKVSLNMIYHWTLALPDFADDPQLANDAILAAIYQEWFEEENSL
jgi:FeS assembly protein IscX